MPNFDKINQHYETLKKEVTLRKNRPKTTLKSKRSRQRIKNTDTEPEFEERKSK